MGQIARKEERFLNRRVLMLLFFHPPVGGSASYRNALMALHLEEEGMEPVILSAAGWRTYFDDPTIPHRRPDYRVPAFDPAVLLAPLRKIGAIALSRWIERVLFFPDRAVSWGLLSLPVALREASRSDVIYSSSPPESAHLLAWLLKKLTRKPWIADFRTEWSDNPGAWFPWRGFHALHRRLEEMLLRDVDHIMTISPAHEMQLRARGIPAEKITTIRVGWNPAESFPPELPTPRKPARILYAGVFADVRSIEPFLDVVEMAVAYGGVSPESFELHIVGHPWELPRRLQQSRISVVVRPHVPRARMIGVLREADWLLITLEPHAPGRIPNKMYEYVSAGRPILAVVPPSGEVARWVEETQTGFVVPAGEGVDSARAFTALFRRWEDRELHWKPRLDLLGKETVDAMGRRFGGIVASLTRQGGAKGINEV